MPRYRVFYLKEELSRRFRELPAASVRKQLKPKDYSPVAEMEAANEYAVWRALQAPDAALPDAKTRRAFTVGDVLEREDGKPLLCLFGGFEEATWWSPEAEGARSADGGHAEDASNAAPAPDASPQPPT